VGYLNDCIDDQGKIKLGVRNGDLAGGGGGPRKGVDGRKNVKPKGPKAWKPKKREDAKGGSRWYRFKAQGKQVKGEKGGLRNSPESPGGDVTQPVGQMAGPPPVISENANKR